MAQRSTERKLLDLGAARVEYFARGSGPLVVLLPSLSRGAFVARLFPAR